MKKITLTIATILLTGLLFAQDFTPPKVASDAFKAQYPSAVVDEWVDFEEDGEIVCYFDENGIFGSAYFTTRGAWVRTVYNVTMEELPDSAVDQLSENYIGYEIMDITEVIDDSGSVYNIYLYSSESETNLLIVMDPSGEIISEEEIITEDDSFE